MHKQRTNCQEHMIAKSRDPYKGVQRGAAQQTVSNKHSYLPHKDRSLYLSYYIYISTVLETLQEIINHTKFCGKM